MAEYLKKLIVVDIIQLVCYFPTIVLTLFVK